MQTYEYRVALLQGEDNVTEDEAIAQVEQRLNWLGERGWRLVSVFANTADVGHFAYFMREKEKV